MQVTVSIGIATAGPGETADDLLRNADVAMYVAKRRGKGRAETYESRMHADVRERLELEAALRGALDRNELTLHYQPIVALDTGADPRASRRWCAGSTRRSATSCRSTSSPSPRRPGSSCSSAGGC